MLLESEVESLSNLSLVILKFLLTLFCFLLWILYPLARNLIVSCICDSV